MTELPAFLEVMNEQALCGCGCGKPTALITRATPNYKRGDHRRFLPYHHLRLTATSLEEKFWSRVQKGPDCWEWIGSRFPDSGYGRLSLGQGETTYAHRLSHELNIGPIPAGMDVCHKCDNPPCVRPEHLFAGTRRDNYWDMRRKGRGPSDAFVLKLTDERVRALRDLREMGYSFRALGRIFGVGKQTIKFAVERKTWSHVE